MKLPPLIRPKVEVQPTLDTAQWLMRLRWVACAGQLLTMASVVWLLRIPLPTWELSCLVGVTGLTNLFFGLWLSHLHRSGVEARDRLPQNFVISLLMLGDVLVLTGMLYISAGIANPFALFYFVNIAVAGAIVDTRWAWALWAMTVGGVTLLLIRSQPLEPLSSGNLQAASGAPVWTIPKLGFFVSFAACSGVITYFITVLTGELRLREKAMQEAEDARVRNRQLEGLATLAAGAAHELATPLSTIAVVAGELSRALEKAGASDSSKSDVTLIRSELDQCRKILDRMTSAAGDAAGERLRSIALGEFLQETIAGLRQPQRVDLQLSEEDEASCSLLPVEATAQAIRNLIQNAMDAGDADVQVLASVVEGQWCILVKDEGHGMPPEVLERIGEPFFTTKEPGSGMGLGLYLAENVLRRLNGKLTFDTEPNQGTTAEVLLPTARY